MVLYYRDTSYFRVILFRSIFNFPYLLGLDIPVPLIHGYMLYLYILYLTGRQPNRYNWLLHFAPAIITYIYLINFFILTLRRRSIYMNMVLLPTESSEKLLRWLLFHPVFYTLYSAFWQLAGIKTNL